jgi:hypothetical protein
MNDEYREMRAAAVKVEGELLQNLVRKCQENDWLKLGGIDFADGLMYEGDYKYALERYDDKTMLRKFFEHGNWSIRTAVTYADLIFVNQVNGGDEWWTLKIDGDNLIPFESITWRLIIQRGDFDRFLDRLTNATVEQCRSLTY